MCMEDVRLGRKVSVVQKTIALTVNSQSLLDADPKRVSVIICTPTLDTVTISLSDPAILASGILLTPSLPPIHLDIKSHGNLVCKAMNIIGVAGTGNITILEGRLDNE